MAGPYDAGMLRQTFAERKRLRELPRDELRAGQLTRLNGLLAAILPHNGFYAKKLGGSDLPLRSLEDFSSLPFTFKEELVTAPVAREFCANLTWPLSQYVRYHQTSGTRGKPMAILDTAEDWNWWMDIWQFNFDAAEMMPDDRVVMAFSFGPFIGFWSAFEAAVARGCLVIPTGGMSTLARLGMIRSCRATVLLCTPSYALRMAEVAAENNIDIAALQVRRIIVAG